MGTAIGFSLANIVLNNVAESSQRFADLTNKIEEFGKTARHVAGADVATLVSTMEAMNDAQKQIAKDSGSRGLLGRAADFVNDMSSFDFGKTQRKEDEAFLAARSARREAEAELTQNLKEQVEIAQMREAGLDKEADAAQRRQDQEKEIARLRQQGVKDADIALIQERNRANEAAKQRQEQEQITKQLQQQADADRKKGEQAFDAAVNERLLSPSERAAKRRQRLEKERAQRMEIAKDLQREDNAARNRRQEGAQEGGNFIDRSRLKPENRAPGANEFDRAKGTGIGLTPAERKERFDRIKDETKARDPNTAILADMRKYLADLKSRFGPAGA